MEQGNVILKTQMQEVAVIIALVRLYLFDSHHSQIFRIHPLELKVVNCSLSYSVGYINKLGLNVANKSYFLTISKLANGFYVLTYYVQICNSPTYPSYVFLLYISMY